MLVAQQTNAKDTTHGLRTHNRRLNKHKQKNNNNDVDIIAKEDVAFFTQISRGLQSFLEEEVEKVEQAIVPMYIANGEVNEVQQAYTNIVPNASTNSRPSGKSGKGSGKSGKASSGKSGKGSGSGGYSRRQY
jgi:hypothetical protein